MNTFKKTLALLSALTIGAVALTACGDKEGDSGSSKEASGTTASGTSGASTEAPLADTTPKEEDVKAKKGGEKFTVVSWDANDLPYMVAAWKDGWDMIEDQFKGDKKINPTDYLKEKYTNVDVVSLDVGSAKAVEGYEARFAAGDDTDVFVCENAFVLKYMDDTRALPMSDVGLSTANFPNRYEYTDQLGLSAEGVLKGLTWQAAPGGFAYRADLAETYLAVKTPEEMQAKVKDWDTFKATAKEVYDKSGANKTSLVASLGNLWEAYSVTRSKSWTENGKLQISDNLETFIDYAKEMRSNGYVSDTKQWDGAWTAIGQTDNTMGYFVSTWGMGAFLVDASGGPKTAKQPQEGKTFRKWKLCQGPNNFFWGGSWLAVNKDTDNGVEAQQFLYAICGDEDVMLKYANAKGEFMNNSVVMDKAELPEENIARQNLGGQDYFKVLNAAAKDISLVAVSPDDQTIKDKFIDAIDKYVAGSLTSKEAVIESFKTEVKTAVPTIDTN
ncbi:MAG: carbohydrate ABC transporter substrate-binding protein [Ruminococcus sp.]|jgi:hypothetical protein|nr:carbohydrate ABC transporter substrate-binding protein [Ruminococcus sp.]